MSARIAGDPCLLPKKDLPLTDENALLVPSGGICAGNHRVWKRTTTGGDGCCALFLRSIVDVAYDTYDAAGKSTFDTAFDAFRSTFNTAV